MFDFAFVDDLFLYFRVVLFTISIFSSPALYHSDHVSASDERAFSCITHFLWKEPQTPKGKTDNK